MAFYPGEQRLQKIEENSFYSPYQFDKSLRQQREQHEKELRTCATFYFDYQYDDEGNCTIISRRIDDV